MKINIVYASVTGNTKLLAEKIKDTLKSYDVELYKLPCDCREADIYFVGSWTDKGNEATQVIDFLKDVKNKKIAIFGTAGFGGSEEYYKRLENRALTNIDPSNSYLGSFYCQGKMPLAVRDRYVKMIKEHPDDQNLIVSIKNFDEALSHPNDNDLSNLEKWVKSIILKLN